MVMNQGKRHIRYTVFVLAGLTVLMTGAARLYASAVDENTPHWLRSVMSLGLAVSVHHEPAPPVEISQAAGLATLRDFTQLGVEGDFAVEVVSAPQYRVSLVPANGQAWSIGAQWQKDGLLRLKGGAGSQGAVLRIEAPMLTSIEAQDLMQLTVRGWMAKKMTLRMKNLDGVHLQDSVVEQWILNAESPVSIQVDKATLSAGLDIRGNGKMSINDADGKKLADLWGTGGRVSIRSNK
jgi:hypothetical protein